MKILLWTDSDGFAGTERHCLDLAQGLEAVGVSVLLGSPGGSPLAEKAEAAGIEVVKLDMKHSPASGLLKVARLLRAKGVDVVHTHNGVSTFFACLAAERAGLAKIVVTQHFITPARESRRGMARLMSDGVHRWIRPRVARWIAISEAVATAMRGRGDVLGGKLRVVRNGVAAPCSGEPSAQEARRWVGLPEEGLVLLCPARLESEKGHFTLLKALEILYGEGHQFDAVLLGGGSLEEALKRRITTLDLRNCVRVVGHQSRPDVWMRASDIVVLPSPAEPFGLVLAEAMSRGVPVVAAAAGGPLEIVEPESGLLFEPDNAQDLAGRLRELVLNPLLRARLGAGGAERWRCHFSSQRMAAEMRAVYEEVSEDG